MKKYSYLCYSVIVSILFLFFTSCKEDAPSAPEPFKYSIPEENGDGWQTADIRDYGIKIQPLAELSDEITYGIISNVHSLLIIKEGKLVFEEYWSGNQFDINGSNFHGLHVNFTRKMTHNQASVTKSIASTLLGIALDKGFFTSVNEKVYSFFPEYANFNTGEKRNMTLEHLLTMTSGFEWNESNVSYGNRDNDLIQMWYVPDPLLYIMSKELYAPPGTSFYYNSGCTNILGEIVYKTSGQKADEFAALNLFGPLGITNYLWEKFNNGVVFVSGDLKIRPRDMAKFGYLFLSEGKWNGNQLVSKEWVTEATTPHVSINQQLSYGYQWWIETHNYRSQQITSYSARGWGGQRIQIFKELDLVVVLTGGNYVGYTPVDDIIQDVILPAILGN